MRMEKLKKLKTLIVLLMITVSVMILPSCVISSQTDETNDKTMSFVNGVYENEIITANFLVEFKMFQTNVFGKRVNEVTSKGSAVVFDVENPSTATGVYTYYLLTNNHVVYENPVYSGCECVITDCYGASYTANVLYKDADYDLAVLSFECREDYKVLSFALLDPQVDDAVMSIGSPLGVLNAVTVGKVSEYTKIALSIEDGNKEEMSNVQFDVIHHTAYVNNGSSGGVLLDENYRICGINYAAEMDGDKYIGSYAVPVTKVVEFINMQNQESNLS